MTLQNSSPLQGWRFSELGEAIAAIAVVGVASMSLGFGVLRGRLNQD